MIKEDVGVQLLLTLLHTERSQLKWIGHLVKTPKETKTLSDPGCAGEITLTGVGVLEDLTAIGMTGWMEDFVIIPK